MDQKYQDFYNLVNGKFIEVEDSANYAQCMDLAFKWCDTLGIPRDTIRHLYAYQVWTMPFDSTKQRFNFIPNSATNIPKTGSLVIFGQAVGIAGHISIAAPGSTGQDLWSLDQNWGSNKASHLVKHANYSGVLGWLEPKVAAGDDVLLSKIQAVVNGSGTPQDKIRQIRAILI